MANDRRHPFLLWARDFPLHFGPSRARSLAIISFASPVLPQSREAGFFLGQYGASSYGNKLVHISGLWAPFMRGFFMRINSLGSLS